MVQAVMFSKVSVLVPTRGRVANLQRLLVSFDTTVGVNAEIVFRADEDDAETIDFLEGTPWTVLVGPRLQGYRSLPVFFEEMRAAADGDVLMCGNDDMTFTTPGWDWLILQVANQYPDGIFNLAVSTYNPGAVPFSIVSKSAVEAIGHLHDPRIYWGDIYLRDVMAAFGRVIPVPDVRVEHHWMGRTPDAVFTESQQDTLGQWTPEFIARHQAAVRDAVNKLRLVAA